MAMKPYTMEVPWAGSRKATLTLANTRILEAIDEFAKANKIKPVSVVARFKGIFQQEGTVLLKYRIEDSNRG